MSRLARWTVCVKGRALILLQGKSGNHRSRWKRMFRPRGNHVAAAPTALQVPSPPFLCPAFPSPPEPENGALVINSAGFQARDRSGAEGCTAAREDDFFTKSFSASRTATALFVCSPDRCGIRLLPETCRQKEKKMNAQKVVCNLRRNQTDSRSGKHSAPVSSFLPSWRNVRNPKIEAEIEGKRSNAGKLTKGKGEDES